METFFILLVLAFVPFIWFINRALTYTSDTVGENAPLRRERTYHFSASQYFFTFTKVLEAFLFVMSLVTMFMMIGVTIHHKEYSIFLLVPFFLGFSGFLGFYFYFDWQYWLITRNVVLTLDPISQSITVDSPDQYSVFTPDNLVRLEHHMQKMDNHKNPLAGYGYYLFYKSDGQVIQLNNLFIGHLGHVEFMERFFSHVPQAIIWHHLAWATDARPTEISSSSNFASPN